MSLLSAALFLLTFGCGNNPASSSLREQPESEAVTEALITEEATTAVTELPTPAESTTAQTTELPTQESTVASFSERQIVESICVELGEEQFLEEPYSIREANDEFHVYENYADYLMHKAEAFPDRCLGSISGEDDLIGKARAVWIESLGTEFIEYIEREYVEVDGVKMKLERFNPPYRVDYYEEYDVWYIVTNPPSGRREDGVGVAAILDLPPYLLIRGEDGMILGAFI